MPAATLGAPAAGAGTSGSSAGGTSGAGRGVRSVACPCLNVQLSLVAPAEAPQHSSPAADAAGHEDETEQEEYLLKEQGIQVVSARSAHLLALGLPLPLHLWPAAHTCSALLVLPAG